MFNLSNGESESSKKECILSCHSCFRVPMSKAQQEDKSEKGLQKKANNEEISFPAREEKKTEIFKTNAESCMFRVSIKSRVCRLIIWKTLENAGFVLLSSPKT